MKARSVLIVWGVAIAALMVWTGVAHLKWMRCEPSLHGLPAFFLGLLVLIVGQVLVRLGMGAFKHGVRWLFSGATFRMCGWALLFALSTIVLFYNLELWRGKRAWARVELEAVERGESLDLRTVIPQHVPEDRNFAAAPLFAPMIAALAANAAGVAGQDPVHVYPGSLPFVAMWEKLPAHRVAELKYFPWLDQEPTAFRPWLRFWQAWTNTPAMTDAGIPRPEIAVPEVEPAQAAALVLNSLKTFEPDLDQLRQFSDRPFCRFPLDYSRQLLHQHHGLTLLNGYARILRLRASALLELHRDEEAFRDVQLALRLVDYARQQPWPETSEPRLWIFVDAVQPVWEGLTQHLWTGAQLELLQRQLQELNLLGDYAANARNDAFAMADFIESAIPTSSGSRVPPIREAGPGTQPGLSLVRLVYPTGWSLQDQATIHQLHLQTASVFVDLTSRRVTDEGSVASVLFASSDPFFPIIVVPKVREMYSEACEIYPFAQTVADLAAVAIALERYRMARGHYPEALDALVSDFTPTPPHDVITGELPKYRRTADDRFLLYSVGFDRTDDGGKPSGRLKSSYGGTEQRYDLHQNDWVWTWPSRLAETQAK